MVNTGKVNILQDRKFYYYELAVGIYFTYKYDFK